MSCYHFLHSIEGAGDGESVFEIRFSVFPLYLRDDLLCRAVHLVSREEIE